VRHLHRTHKKHGYRIHIFIFISSLRKLFESGYHTGGLKRVLKTLSMLPIGVNTNLSFSFLLNGVWMKKEIGSCDLGTKAADPNQKLFSWILLGNFSQPWTHPDSDDNPPLNKSKLNFHPSEHC
jgi:hypothetical protein